MIRISDITALPDGMVEIEYSLDRAIEHSPKWRKTQVPAGTGPVELEWRLRQDWSHYLHDVKREP